MNMACGRGLAHNPATNQAYEAEQVFCLTINLSRCQELVDGPSGVLTSPGVLLAVVVREPQTYARAGFRCRQLTGCCCMHWCPTHTAGSEYRGRELLDAQHTQHT